MNRIAIAAEKLFTSPVEPSWHDLNPAAAIRRRISHRIDTSFPQPQATFAPLHYEPGYSYPLVVWLHGRGANEQHLRRVMPHVSMQNYVAVAPRGTQAGSQRRPEFDWLQTEEGIADAETHVMHSIAAAEERFNIHADRIFLAGSGSGGTMATRVAWNQPQRFAGVATLGGPLPSQLCPLRRVNDLRQLPCLVSTSRLSSTYPERDVCRDLRLLHAAGCTVALRQYPGGDDMTTGMLSDLNHWLMELVCGEAVVEK